MVETHLRYNKVIGSNITLCLPPNHFRNLFQFEEQIFCPFKVCMLFIRWSMILYWTCVLSLIQISSIIVSKLSETLTRAPSVVWFWSSSKKRFYEFDTRYCLLLKYSFDVTQFITNNLIWFFQILKKKSSLLLLGVIRLLWWRL